MKRKGPFVMAFLVPLLIAVIICIDHEIYPFGKQCMLHIDMYHQYCPFFTELMEKIKTGGSMFYSWNIGLGADFVSLYAYYLASPLNWLIALCPKGYVIEFMTFLVLLKIALCGLTFAYYLQQHFLAEYGKGAGERNGSAGMGGADQARREIASYACAIFGTAYALSAFMAAYAWNIMWTDCMVLAPLAILGLERLIKEGRPVLYYVALSFCILSNYYISIMVCIFLVLWFFLFWAEHKESGYKAWLRFAWYSLLAGGTGAALILPTAAILGYSGASGISFPESVEWYFHIVSELARSLINVEVYTGDAHWPNLYCGIFAIVFLLLYLCNGKITWKNKIPRLALLVLFWISFANNILDFIWHGLHFPTSLPGRQSFLYVFTVLVIAYEAFLKLRGNRLWHVAAAGVTGAAFFAAAYCYLDETTMERDSVYISAVFLGCYLLLVTGYLVGNAGLKKVMLAIGCFAVVAELTLNFDVTGLDTVSRQAYVENLADYRTVLAAVEAQQRDVETEAGKQGGAVFYRTEELERKTKNDAALSGYRSATQFSSLMNLNVSHFYQSVGMEGGKNFYCAGGATPLLSAMLSIRYVLADNALEESPIRSLAAQSGNTYLYENAYVLPLGFMMSEETIAAWDYENLGDIGAQNALAELLGSDEAMLTPVASVSTPGESSFDAGETGYYYATYEKTTVDNLTEEVSDGRTRSFTKVSHGYTLDLGYCQAGTNVKVTNTSDETVQMTVYYLNMEALDTAYQKLASQVMELTAFSDTRVAGKIRVEQPGRLIFSIAKEEGWTLYVDGEKTESESFGGAFLSIHLEPGEHEIELRYHSPGFAAGAWISVAAVALFALTMLIRRKLSYRNTLRSGLEEKK